jgi:hypothetical protein
VLPILPYALIIAGRDLWAAGTRTGLRAARAVAVAILLLTTLHHRALLSLGEARWRGATLATDMGALPGQISSSWEWDAYNGSFDRFIATGTGASASPSLRVALNDYFYRWLPHSMDRALYVSASVDSPPAEGPHLRVLATLPFRDTFLRTKNVYLLFRTPFPLFSCSGGHETEFGGAEWWRWTPDMVHCTFGARVGPPVTAVVAFEYWTPVMPRDVLVEVAGRSTRVRLLSGGKRTYRSEPLSVRENRIDVSIRLDDGSPSHRLSDTDPRMAAFLIQNLRLEVLQ